MGKLAIVCDGKEISYGLGLLHLFQYKNEGITFTSKRGMSISAEIYTIASFKRAGIPKDSIIVCINKDLFQSSDNKSVFNEDGIQIFNNGNKYTIFSNPEYFEEDDYKGFLQRAIQKKDEYCKTEKEYVNRVNSLCVGWLPGEFSEVSLIGILRKNRVLKKMMQQQYDYVAYVLYHML